MADPLPTLTAEQTLEADEVLEAQALIPMTLSTLAARKGEAIEVYRALLEILEVARRRAIAMTFPEDWVGFRAPDNRVTCYLQDAGCARVRDVLGVEIYNVGNPERLVAADGKSFIWIIRGDGRARLTQQTIVNIEGGGSSTAEICKGVTGAALELLVRKLARANLDGRIVRELMGLEIVPHDELRSVWMGTTRNADHIRKGKGFGSGDERHGAAGEGVPTIPPPTCWVCPPVNGKPVALVYRRGQGNRPPFYGCPNYDKHPNERTIVDVAEWVAKSAAAAPAASTETRDPGAEG